MQALSDLNPAYLHAILLTLCYLLLAIGIIKIALYVLMTLTPGIWETLIKRENAFYIKIGVLSEKGSDFYKKIQRSVWTKAFFGCSGLATIFFALAIILLVRWMQTLPFTQH